MNKITLADVERVAFSLAKELMEWDEPIPDFQTRYPHILESCLATPFQTFARRKLYRGLIEKGSVLFYLMIKNHPFENGNKRVAMTTLLVFLMLNGKWLKVDTVELYNFAKWVAASNPKVKDETVSAVVGFIKQHLIDL